MAPKRREVTRCPVCGGSMPKRVNAEWDEIWLCTACPMVLFAYHDTRSLRRVAVEVGDSAADLLRP